MRLFEGRDQFFQGFLLQLGQVTAAIMLDLLDNPIGIVQDGHLHPVGIRPSGGHITMKMAPRIGTP